MTIQTPFRALTPELVEIQRVMQGHASQYGLDYFTTVFELVTADQLHAVAAYGGFPTRYPHWRFGMEFEQLRKGFSYGLQKIYELVINNDPCYAYLLDSNSLTDHKLVIAHVYGHCDFFKNNMWFAKTNRHMIDEMANHGSRIRAYMDRFGTDVVEDFIDACLSIEDLVDIHSPFIERRDRPQPYSFPEPLDAEERSHPTRFEAKDYMDSFINPPHALAADQVAQAQKHQRASQQFPATPERDLMLFILEHAPLKPWQSDVLSMLRDEAYYFAPQGQTKIMNEGWATFWHSTIMTRHGIEPNDLICYAERCAGTLASSAMRLNPYKLGLELFRDIEDRWNRGAFGPEYDACDDYEERRRWNKFLGKGREKIFEVRRIHNDLTFVDEFLTLEFCERHKLFQFGLNASTGDYEIESRRFADIKSQLLANLTNLGRPRIAVVDGNYGNRGELYLLHDFDGVELQKSFAQDTLASLVKLWRRPVHIETSLEGKPTILSHDGNQARVEQKFPPKEAAKAPKPKS